MACASQAKRHPGPGQRSKQSKVGFSMVLPGVDWIILGRMQIHTYILIYIGNDLDV